MAYSLTSKNRQRCFVGCLCWMLGYYPEMEKLSEIPIKNDLSCHRKPEHRNASKRGALDRWGWADCPGSSEHNSWGQSRLIVITSCAKLPTEAIQPSKKLLLNGAALQITVTSEFLNHSIIKKQPVHSSADDFWKAAQLVISYP